MRQRPFKLSQAKRLTVIAWLWARTVKSPTAFAEVTCPRLSFML